jgi:hypothetical protein
MEQPTDVLSDEDSRKMSEDSEPEPSVKIRDEYRLEIEKLRSPETSPVLRRTRSSAMIDSTSAPSSPRPVSGVLSRSEIRMSQFFDFFLFPFYSYFF